MKKVHEKRGLSATAAQGYTLVELMVVLSVILILAAMAIPGFQNMTNRAHVHRAKDAMNQLRQAQVLYKADRQVYATDVTSLYRYGNLTSFLKYFDGDSITCPGSPCIPASGEDFYTITAKADDIDKTPVTGTERSVYP